MAALQDDEEPEFQIAPMIDMLLVLLIFFMSITTTDVMMKDRNVILPESTDAQKAKKGQDIGQTVVNVGVDREANNKTSMSIEQVEYTQQALTSELSQRRADFVKLNPKVKYRVLVRADEGVEYRYLQEVMRSCAEAGINAITFSVIQVGEYARGVK